MKKDRGIKEFDDYLGNLSKEIQKKINLKGKVKILDAGCGYGLVMAGLIKRFGNSVEIIGYNQKREHGTIKDFKEKTIKDKIFTKEEIKKLNNFPKILYLDADNGLPFKTNSFDFIYSLASVYLYKDKIKFFEECNRILKSGGIARIHLFETSIFGKKQEIISKNKFFLQKNFLEIKNNEKETDFIDYLKKFKNLKIKIGKRKDNFHSIIYLEIRKIYSLNFNLKFVNSIDLSSIAPDKFGIKSIYSQT